MRKTVGKCEISHTQQSRRTRNDSSLFGELGIPSISVCACHGIVPHLVPNRIRKNPWSLESNFVVRIFNVGQSSVT